MARAAAVRATSDSRELILVAALRAFAENGFDGATTRDIAGRAGVNHGLIPYYFGGKQKLWQAAVDRAFAQLGAGLDTVLNDPTVADDRERTGLLIRNYVRFIAQNPEFVLMMHDEGKRRGPRMRYLVDRHVKPLYEAMRVLLERTQGRGLLPADIAPIHFHYILAGSVGLIFHQAEECRRLSGLDPFDPAVVEDHARAVEHLLLGPAPKETPG
jgi:AcrR family transcriptional regulator